MKRMVKESRKRKRRDMSIVGDHGSCSQLFIPSITSAHSHWILLLASTILKSPFRLQFDHTRKHPLAFFPTRHYCIYVILATFDTTLFNIKTPNPHVHDETMAFNFSRNQSQAISTLCQTRPSSTWPFPPRSQPALSLRS